MVIRAGEKIHIAERRRFESDMRRHFIGEVLEADGAVIRARGYTFLLNTSTGLFEKKIEPRTRIFSAADANNIINVLSDNTEIEHVEYVYDSNRRLIVTDERDLHFDINEFGSQR